MNQEQNQPVFELRQYDIFEGQLDRWVEYMDSTIIPFQRSLGFVVVGSWYSREKNQYIWIRRFESEAERERLYKVAYEHEFWLNDALPVVLEMLSRDSGRTITDMHASPLSILR